MDNNIVNEIIDRGARDWYNGNDVNPFSEGSWESEVWQDGYTMKEEWYQNQLLLNSMSNMAWDA